MSVTPTNSGGPQGMALQAWALVNPATGAIIKGSNIASAVNGTAGVYTVTFSNAMANANYLVRVRGDINAAGVFLVAYNSRVAANFVLNMKAGQGNAGGWGAVAQNPEALHIEVYA